MHDSNRASAGCEGLATELSNIYDLAGSGPIGAPIRTARTHIRSRLLHEDEAITEGLTGWETTRLSKHFILLDFLADRTVYRGGTPLAFDQVWNDEHDSLARGLCNVLLEPLMAANLGPISVADSFWPSVFKTGHSNNFGPKHRWTEGEATVDIALYRLVDEGKRGRDLKKAVEAVKTIDGCRDRIISYSETEFLCVTFKPEGARKCGQHPPRNAADHCLSGIVKIATWFVNSVSRWLQQAGHVAPGKSGALVESAGRMRGAAPPPGGRKRQRPSPGWVETASRARLAEGQ